MVMNTLNTKVNVGVNGDFTHALGFQMFSPFHGIDYIVESLPYRLSSKSVIYTIESKAWLCKVIEPAETFCQKVGHENLDMLDNPMRN